MAADDIYSVQLRFEAPSGAASLKLYYQESIAQTSGFIGTQILADSWNQHLTSFWLAVLADDWWMPAITVRKHTLNPAPAHREDVASPQGLRSGPSLPANNSWLIGIAQSLFPARSNGRVNVPGVPEPDTSIGALTNAFQTGPVQALLDQLITEVPEVSAGAGRWKLGVISDKVLNASPPFKDWDGAFAEAVVVQANTIIATQRRRQTKVRGQA